MRLSKQQLINRFTTDEVTAILSAKKTSIDVEAWLFRFDNTTPDSDGTAIDLCDPLVIDGIKSLETAGLIGAGRADEIIGSVTSFAGFTLGQSVSVLPPFNDTFPDVYTIEGFDTVGNAVIVDNGHSFSPDYIRAI